MNKKTPLVSIVIFTYNHSSFIHETIEGALSQTYKNIEIIIADDCSTDGNIEIIHDFMERFPGKIKAIIGENNQGITKNANRGIAACTGQYIAMVGGDDVIFPTKIEKQMNWMLKNNKRAICGHGLNICDENTQITGLYSHIIPKSGKGRVNWIKYGPLFGATSIIVNKIYLPSPAYDERVPIVSDWKLYIDVLDDDLEYGYVDEILGLYRKHSNNVTGNVIRGILDLENCIQICKLQYPKYSKEIKMGESYLIDYGYGNYYSTIDNINLSIKFYISAIKKYPFNWKAYLKIISLMPKFFKSFIGS